RLSLATPRVPSLRHGFARAAELLRKVLQLREAVLHGEHGLGVVHVHGGYEFQRGNRRGVDVDEPQGGVVGHERAAAFGGILRWLSGVFWNVAMCSAPDVTRTASGFHRLKAFTGPPDHERQDRQWQYPIASGAPVTSSVTAPQEQLPP